MVEGSRGNPYREDLFQKIVNIQLEKRGAIFVGGDVCCFNWYIKAEKIGGAPRVQFHGIGTLGFTDLGSTDGAAYGAVGANKHLGKKGRPTFCLGGMHSEGSGDGGITIYQVYTSHDGLSWSQTFNQISASGENEINMDGGNWNGHRFNIGELISSTGHGWSRGGGGGRGDGGGTDNQGRYHSAASVGADYLVFAGGIWCKANDQDLLVSLDDLKSWVFAGRTSEFAVTCLCGGALADFP